MSEHTVSGQPLVSIILPCYNRAGFIAETVQSVIEQTYSRWELIIVDDGSSDNTTEVVKRFQDHRIRYFELSHSGFIGKVRNFGIAQGSGELVAFLDSDDLWRMDKLEFQIALLQKHPSAAFMLSNGDQFGVGAVQTPDYEHLFVGRLFLPILEEERFCLYSPSFIFKREVIEKIGRLDESVATTRDVQFMLRLSALYDGIFTNERLIKIRKHQQNTSTLVKARSLYNYGVIAKEFFEKGMINGSQLRRITRKCYYKIGLFHKKHRQYSEAAKAFLLYIRMTPWDWKGWARLFQTVISWPTSHNGLQALRV